MCFRILGLLVLLSKTVQISGQQREDTVQYNNFTSDIRDFYFHEIGDNAQIYHGGEFIRNGQKVNGFPFYQSDSMLAGIISYQGVNYPAKPLQYNLVSQELIIQNYPKNTFMVLSPEKVDSFIVFSHVFVSLSATKYSGMIKSGYYDCIFPGDPGVYVRREKRLVTPANGEELRYLQYDNYFILLKNIFYAVDDKSALLDLFKDQKDQLKKYIRTQKLDFKKNKETALVLLTKYYSRLSH